MGDALVRVERQRLADVPEVAGRVIGMESELE